MATKKKVSKPIPPVPPKARVRRAKKEVSRAEDFIAAANAAAVEKPKRTRSKDPWGHLTKEQITHARDVERLSWRDVANKLELKSPSTARNAYTALTGRPHNESQVIVTRAPKGVGGITGKHRAKVITAPAWDDWTEDEEVIAAITGRTIIVARQYGKPEEIRVTSGTERTGRAGQWKVVKVLQHGVRVRNCKNEKVDAHFCFTQEGTGHSRTVNVKDILAIR